MTNDRMALATLPEKGTDVEGLRETHGFNVAESAVQANRLGRPRPYGPVLALATMLFEFDHP